MLQLLIGAILCYVGLGQNTGSSWSSSSSGQYARQSFTCTSNAACSLTCGHSEACINSTVICPGAGYTCTIACSASNSCYGMSISGDSQLSLTCGLSGCGKLVASVGSTDTDSHTVSCSGALACKDTSVTILKGITTATCDAGACESFNAIANASKSLDLTCNGATGCKNMKIYCPTSYLYNIALKTFNTQTGANCGITCSTTTSCEANTVYSLTGLTGVTFNIQSGDTSWNNAGGVWCDPVYGQTCQLTTSGTTLSCENGASDACTNYAITAGDTYIMTSYERQYEAQPVDCRAVNDNVDCHVYCAEKWSCRASLIYGPRYGDLNLYCQSAIYTLGLDTLGYKSQCTLAKVYGYNSQSMTIYATTSGAIQSGTITTGTGNFNLYCKDTNSCSSMDATIRSYQNVSIECDKGTYSCEAARFSAPKSTYLNIQCDTDYACKDTNITCPAITNSARTDWGCDVNCGLPAATACANANINILDGFPKLGLSCTDCVTNPVTVKCGYFSKYNESCTVNIADGSGCQGVCSTFDSPYYTTTLDPTKTPTVVPTFAPTSPPTQHVNTTTGAGFMYDAKFSFIFVFAVIYFV